MKYKIVVKVQMRCGKCRTKAMKIAAVESGVSSVQIEGENKDLVVVIGDEVDSVCLTQSLRKKVGFATILSVEELVEEPEEEEEEEEEEEDDVPAVSVSRIQPPNPYSTIVYDDPNPINCPIL